MVDPAQLPLLDEVIHAALGAIHIILGGVFIDVVEQVEIKIIHPAGLQLFFKGLRKRNVNALDHLMARELIRKIPAFPGVSCQGFADGKLRLACVVGLGSVKIIHTVGESIVHHLVYHVLVNIAGAAAGEQGQAHGAEAQGGKLLILKLFIDHSNASIIFLQLINHTMFSKP